MAICKAAFDLIVEQEISDEATYRKKYQHFDWPDGASGPTVGIGYDCGYCVPAEIRRDWQGILPEAAIAVLVSASGITGAKASGWVRAHKRDVTITWEQAYRQFVEREIPKWEARLAAAVPNVDRLPDDCRGALLSIAYNRGCSFGLDGPRYAEMRAIKAHMAAQDFASIPKEIRSMKRLWPNARGLRARRDAEAALFARGLATLRRPPGETPVVTQQWPDADAYLPENSRTGPKPGAVTTAVKSPSIWASVMTLLYLVASTIGEVGHWIAGHFDWLFGLVPGAAGDVHALLDPVQDLGSMLKLDLGPMIPYLIIGAVVMYFVRHLRDKRELTARRVADETATDAAAA